MKPVTIAGVELYEQKIHRDHRGTFEQVWSAASQKLILQTNLSRSTQGVLRGLHIQRDFPQGKLLRCLEGQIWDVWVDLRPTSPTLGRWDFHVLDWKTPESLFIPPGLAHGFLTLSQSATLLYHCTELYDAKQDGGIRWDDPDIGVAWPIAKDAWPVLSSKDSDLPLARDYLAGRL